MLCKDGKNQEKMSPLQSCLSKLSCSSSFCYSHYSFCRHLVCAWVLATTVWETRTTCTDASWVAQGTTCNHQEHPENSLIFFLLLNCDRGKTKQLNRAWLLQRQKKAIQLHSLELPREFGKEKSTNWGRTRKKWKLGKPDFWQQRNHFIWWAKIQVKLRQIRALWTRWRYTKSNAELFCCAMTVWCLSLNVLRKCKPGTENALEKKKCLWSR